VPDPLTMSVGMPNSEKIDKRQAPADKTGPASPERQKPFDAG
jgi:hypothetical protein